MANASNNDDWDDIYADLVYVDSIDVDYEYPDTAAVDEYDMSILQEMSLNDIRFANWTDYDWNNNDYIRELRSWLDDYLAGKIVHEVIDEFRDKLTGKFIVLSLEPYMLGGVSLAITFIDHQDVAITSWIYSTVEDGVVAGYETLSVFAQDFSEAGVTTELIYQFLEEVPDAKAW